MPNMQLPAIDMNSASQWDEQDVSLYHALPYYLAETQVDRRKTWMTHSKLVDKTKWVANSGDIMKGVQKVPSPHVRQFIFPNALTSKPLKDVTDVREVTYQGLIYRHRHESQVMNFVPSFRDFLKNHIEAQSQNLMEKQERSEEIYLRTSMWYYSPYVYLCGADTALLASPRELGNAANTAVNTKNLGWLQATLPQVKRNLQLLDLFSALNLLENNLRAMPYKGSTLPKDDQGLTDRFALVCSSEAFNQFALDPFRLQYRDVNMEVSQGNFKGNFWGRITAKIEDLPIRIAADGTFPQPEIREGNADAWDYQDTVANPAYVAAPYEIAWLYGKAGYKAIEVGPPPSAFVNGSQPKNFQSMFWNGEVRLINNFLVETVKEDGSVGYDTNHYAEYVKFISQTAYGIMPMNRRNVLPIIIKRKVGL